MPFCSQTTPDPDGATHRRHRRRHTSPHRREQWDSRPLGPVDDYAHSEDSIRLFCNIAADKKHPPFRHKANAAVTRRLIGLVTAGLRQRHLGWSTCTAA